MATPAQRALLVRKAHVLLANEPLIDYSQARPYPRPTWAQLLARFRAGEHIALDCSDSVTLLCMWSGLHDPNGRAYNGTGYTGTLLDGPCPHYFDPGRARAGALVVFGPGTGEHAAMVIEPDPRNPLLFSHGAEAGPIAIRLHDEAQYHNPPTTFLSIAHL